MCTMQDKGVQSVQHSEVVMYRIKNTPDTLVMTWAGLLKTRWLWLSDARVAASPCFASF